MLREVRVSIDLDGKLMLGRQPGCDRGSVRADSLNPAASGLVAKAALNRLEPCGLRVGADKHADEQATRAHARSH